MIRQFVKKICRTEMSPDWEQPVNFQEHNVGHCPVSVILYVAYQKVTLIRSSGKSTSPYVLPFHRTALR